MTSPNPPDVLTVQWCPECGYVYPYSLFSAHGVEMGQHRPPVELTYRLKPESAKTRSFRVWLERVLPALRKALEDE